MQIVAYDGTQEEYDRIITEKTAEGLVLVEVQNITEGNFLGFMMPEEIPQTPSPTPAPLEQRIADLEMAMAAILGGAV